MRFRTSRDTLLRPLRVATGVVERRQTLPVLGNLLVEANDDGLTLRGTDLEVEIVARLTSGIDVEQAGSTTIPAHKLTDIWQSLPDGIDVSVALEQDRAVVRSGRSRFALATIPAAEFPTERSTRDLADSASADESADPVADESEVDIVLPRADMHKLLERTKFAMANGDPRYFLNGLLLELTNHSLRAAASDGHRMALCTLDGGAAGLQDRERAIIPRKSVQDLERLIGDSDEDVHLAVGKTRLRASQGDYTLTTKLVDGPYPDVDRLIPRNTDHSVTGDRETLRQALHRAAILSNDRAPEVRLTMDGELLTIRATNPEHEEAEELVAVDYDGAQTTEIGFNARYIQDVLNAFDTESIRVSMPEGNAIALIEGPGAEDCLYIVMPVRL
ncbi:MAG: DNA polymerase III subunit beta [Gammaproteobacteria bacterium]|nr:DNA polymerase III subunit beta [Gammaproteobacteria bacterium]